MWTNFWTKDVAKEMTNVHTSFEKLDVVTPDKMRKVWINPRCEHANVHMIFDINMDGKFTSRKILLDEGHTIALPSSIT